MKMVDFSCWSIKTINTNRALSMKKEKTIWLRKVINSRACFCSFSLSLSKGAKYLTIKSFQNWVSCPLKKFLLPFFKSRSSIQNGLTVSSRLILTVVSSNPSESESDIPLFGSLFMTTSSKSGLGLAKGAKLWFLDLASLEIELFRRKDPWLDPALPPKLTEFWPLTDDSIFFSLVATSSSDVAICKQRSTLIFELSIKTKQRSAEL